MGIFNCFTNETREAERKRLFDQERVNRRNESENYAAEKYNREMAIYTEKIEQFIEFKNQAYKYEIGLNVFNIVIIDRQKDGKVTPPFFSVHVCFPCMCYWEDEYKIVNTATGEVSLHNEKYIDNLLEAERLIKSNEKTKKK